MSLQIRAQDTATQSATPLFQLGCHAIDEYGREYLYGIANGAVAAGYVAYMATDGSYDFTAADTAGCGTPGTHWKQLGVPNVAVTDNYYAWFWIGCGFFEVVLAPTFAAADVVYTTDAAGKLGADNSSFQVEGLKSIDAAVTDTRVTVFAAGRLTVGITEASD